jgi:hypothetical protein
MEGYPRRLVGAWLLVGTFSLMGWTFLKSEHSGHDMDPTPKQARSTVERDRLEATAFAQSNVE